MQSETLLFGCFDTSISTTLGALWLDLPVFQRALIRCLDSERDSHSIAQVLGASGISAQPTLSGVIIDGAGLRQAHTRGNIFCGFDELWFLNTAQLAVAIPHQVRLTTDGGAVSDEETSEVGKMMKGNLVSLILADGCGMNCLTFDTWFWHRMRQETKEDG